jgi:hypothetical protein
MKFSSSCWLLISIISHIFDFILDVEHVLHSTYSSALDYRSAIYTRGVCLLPNYFYEALAFNVSIAGNHSFWSHSDIDTVGYLYQDDFNPFQPQVNRLSSDDDSCGNSQFLIAHHLLPNTIYILVVPTHGVNAIGRFSVMSAGSATIQFFRSSEYSDCEVSSFGYWMMLE